MKRIALIAPSDLEHNGQPVAAGEVVTCSPLEAVRCLARGFRFAPDQPKDVPPKRKRVYRRRDMQAESTEC